MHYVRWQTHGDVDAQPLRQRERKPLRICAVDGCEKLSVSRNWCTKHYHRWQLHGSTDKPPRTIVRAKGVMTEFGWASESRGYLSVSVGRSSKGVHRLVMERALGRPLLRHESVHHINGDRADNRIENLELWSSAQPPGQRIPDKIAWAVELLRLYDPERLA